MSGVQSRPSAPRGRGASRGGRAGFGSRGGRGGRSHPANGDRADNPSAPPIEDDAAVGQLKKQYGTKVSTIKEMYPDWTDADVVFALQETGGDLELTVERITDGTITQWGEVSKPKKDRSKSKVKESSTNTHTDSGNAPRAARNGPDSGRGGRGRGNERGRGGRGRGAAATQTNGTHTKPAPLSVPTDQSAVWNAPAKEAVADDSKPPTESTGVATSTVDNAKAVASTVVPDGKRTWASMFNKPEPAPKPVKEPVPVVEKVPEKAAPELPVEPEVAQETPQIEVAEPAAVTEDVAPVEETQPVEALVVEEEIAPLAPSNSDLTEVNLEQVLDTSAPAPTTTAASTGASSWDPRTGAPGGTQYSALQGQPAATRPAASGFATSALKATNVAAPRAPSYQRRVLDQEEAVRMPGNREVDRAAVQFGAFSLGGAGELDVDGDREEPETRAQPPQHSPIAHPRASLPPAPAQTTSAPESLPAAKESQGLPAAPHPVAAPGLPTPLPGAQSMSQQGSQGGQYSQYGRYGNPAGQEQQSAFGQKPYDPFSQQAPAAATQYEGYPSQQNQAQTQPQAGAFSSAPSEYSQYYTADQQRHAYQSYYGQQYGQQQSAQAQQDGPSTQQRAFSGYNAPPAETTSPFPQSSSQPAQSRYATAGETQTSGHTTPNPVAQAQQAAQTAQAQQAHPSQPQGQPGGQYPYGNPYYSSPYYAAYMNNYQQGYGQGNYGAGPYVKGGMYNQPHQYGMSPQAPYDHTSSPATGAFSQSALHGRESAVAGGLNDYGRAGSQQSQAAQPLGGAGGFDAFGRNSSYQGQGQQYGQSGQPGASDDLKTFGDSKTGNGPAPSAAQTARPGSAANTTPAQSTLPPPQSSQQSYGGYPSHLQQQHALHGSQTGSQYGGLGGLGGHQAAGQGHQSSQYGGYGQGFAGSYYGNNQQRGGWGNNYQH